MTDYPEDQPTTDAPKRRGLIKKAALVATAPVLLFVGCVSGSAMTEGAEPETITVTETAPPEVITETETITEVVEVEVPVEVPVDVTSEACLLAIAEADELMGLYQQQLLLSADMIAAVLAEDVAWLEQLTDEVNLITDTEMAPVQGSYFVNATECESGDPR